LKQEQAYICLCRLGRGRLYDCKMDIAALVRAGMLSSDLPALWLLISIVNAAFQDASKLVGRIRDQREKAGTPLAEEPTRDLLESLALGPVRSIPTSHPARLTRIHRRSSRVSSITSTEDGRSNTRWAISRPGSRYASSEENDDAT
jgi:hypothetical protein